MLLSFALVLIPVVAVTGQQYEFNNAVRNGYLPPVSSSSSSPSDSIFKAEQSRQTIELSEKDVPICNYQDSKLGLCKYDEKKTENTFDSINSKLEKFLIPKVNNLQPVKESPKPNYSKFNSDSSTVSFEILNTKTDNVISTVTTTKPTTKKSQNELFVNNNVKTIDESRGYLPPLPEYSGAAQTPEGAVKVPQSEQQNDNDQHHHHHHHHHHDENFDICSDPFHSFLCAPLKARKRITGALPERLGQASFNEFRNVLFPSKPSLNKEPKLSSPSNIIESTSFKPTTLKSTFVPTTLIQSTKFQAENSNANDRFYLPPVPDNQNFNSFPVRPDSSNTVTQTTKFQSSSSLFNSPKTTILNNFNSGNSNDDTTIFQPSVTTEKKFLNDFINNKKEVPVKKNFPTSTTSKNQFLSSSVNFFPPVSQPDTTSNPLLKNNAQSQEENSFLSSVGPNLFKTTGSSTSFASNIISSVPSASFNNEPFLSKQPEDNFQKITTFSSNKKQFETSSNFVQPTNFPNLFTDIRLSGNNGQPTFSPTSTAFNNFVSSSQSTLQPASNFIATTLRPFSEKNSLLSSSVTNNILRTNQNEPSSSPPSSSSSPFSFFPLNLNNEYLSTVSKLQNSRNQLTTTIKPSFTTPAKTVTSTKIIEKVTINNLIPQQPFINPVTSQGTSEIFQSQNQKNSFYQNNGDICNDSFQSFLCAKDKVKNVVTGNALTKSTETFNGVKTNIKPSSTFQSLTTQINLPQNTVRNGFSQNQYEPSTRGESSSSLFTTSKLSTIASDGGGYSYPKPSTAFPLPSKTKTSFLPATTLKPTTKFIKNDFSASNEQKSFTGYNYPKPPEPLLPQTDEQKNLQIIKTSSVKYDYPIPEKKFLHSTEESKTVTKTSSSSSSLPIRTNTASASTNTASKGYFYPKPQESLELPQKKGYDYPKPKKQLQLPTDKEFQPLFPDSSTSLEGLSDLGSALFIPVNKLDKRSSSSNPTELSSSSSSSSLKTPKFGERIRKRENKFF